MSTSGNRGIGVLRYIDVVWVISAVPLLKDKRFIHKIQTYIQTNMHTVHSAYHMYIHI